MSFRQLAFHRFGWLSTSEIYLDEVLMKQLQVIDIPLIRFHSAEPLLEELDHVVRHILFCHFWLDSLGELLSVEANDLFTLDDGVPEFVGIEEETLT